MGRNLKMPWSLEDTVENMERIRTIMIKKVRQVNLDRKGEEDVREVNFDFSRVKKALEKQIPMKVDEIHVDEYFCPACGAENNCNEGVVQDKFCHECGQAIYQEN